MGCPGNRLYEFEAKCGLDFMADCYALNVASDADVWCYYYDSFPLVHLRAGQIDAVWKIPIHGSHAFAISEGLALFQGGYNKSQTFHLLELQSGTKTQELAQIRIEDEHGIALRVCENSCPRAFDIHVERLTTLPHGCGNGSLTPLRPISVALDNLSLL